MRLSAQVETAVRGKLVEFTAERKFGGNEVRALLAKGRRSDGAILGFDGYPGGWYELRLNTSPFKDGTLLGWYIARGRTYGSHGDVRIVKPVGRFNGWSRFRDGSPFMRVVRSGPVEVHWSVPPRGVRR